MGDWKKLAQEYEEKEWHFSSVYAWEKVVAKKPTAFNLASFAEELRLSGKSQRALKVMDTVNYEEIPDDYKFIYHVRYGKIYEDQCRIDEAIKSYQLAVDLEPDEAWPYMFLSGLLSRQEKWKERETILKLALSKEGDIDEVYYNLATNHACLGNFAKAIEAMEACLAVDPKYNQAKKWLEDFKNMQDSLLKDYDAN